MRFGLWASAILFVAGFAFPLATFLDPGPSVLAYGIILVSVPIWVLGAASAGAVAWGLFRRRPEAVRLRRLALLLCALNLAAIALCWVWNPEGVS